MDVLAGLLQGFQVALTPANLAFCVVGVVLGTVIGVLPGLGPPATIAMLLPLTYRLDPTGAMIMLAGIYYGAMYGGSTTSILLNIPGESSSVVTCLDGYQLARQGRAGAALGISALGSCIAGTVATLGISLLSPVLAGVAIRFGPPEYFALLVLGLLMVVSLSGDSILKGLIMLAAGMMLSTIGLDPVEGQERYTLGLVRLSDGLQFVVVAMGLFGLSEVLLNLETP